MSEWWDMKAWTVREYTGLGLLALSSVVTAALMTWSVQDPNFSYAPSGPIHNVIGYPGAIGADLLMQTLGLGSITLILPIAVCGWRMVSHRDFDRQPLRFGCWVLCVAIAAAFASCSPRNPEWPLPTGFGGVVGDALVGAPTVVFGSLAAIHQLLPRFRAKLSLESQQFNTTSSMGRLTLNVINVDAQTPNR
jgi:S-DNA-T family DNA segregation ATPase FtsK/SpoIIIE